MRRVLRNSLNAESFGEFSKLGLMDRLGVSAQILLVPFGALEEIRASLHHESIETVLDCVPIKVCEIVDEAFAVEVE